jgi:hypothetical protein
MGCFVPAAHPAEDMYALRVLITGVVVVATAVVVLGFTVVEVVLLLLAEVLVATAVVVGLTVAAVVVGSMVVVEASPSLLGSHALMLSKKAEEFVSILTGGEVMESVGVTQAETKRTMMTLKERQVINAVIFALKDFGRVGLIC